MNDDISPRLAAMREALVTEVTTTATTTTTRHRFPTRGTIVAVVTAFVVGGALTGGLTAAALPGSDPDAAVESSLATTTRYMVEDANHGSVLGTPTFRTAHGNSSTTLTHRPSGADRVAVAWACAAGNAPIVEVAREPVLGTGCGGRGGVTEQQIGWALSEVPSSGDVTVSFTAGDTDRYALWVSWARAPRPAAPSEQQQAETEDGVVTLDEYRTAFNRLVACQAQADQPMGDVPLSWYADGAWNTAGHGIGPWYLYSTPSTGSEAFDTQCYPREFADVDAIWQGEHPMPEDSPGVSTGG